jgi:hypothetical protein
MFCNLYKEQQYNFFFLFSRLDSSILGPVLKSY